MQKILIILTSEFWRRVRSKAFILATLLVPVLLLVMMFAPTLLGYFGEKSKTQRVAVVDQTGERLIPRLQTAAQDDASFTFSAVNAPVDSIRARVQRGDFDGYLILPDSLLDGKGEAFFYSAEGGGGLSGPVRLGSLVETAVRQERLAVRNVSEDVQAIMSANVGLTTRTLTEEGSKADSTVALGLLGFIMSFTIYFAIFLYGNYVMQGVIEEKSNRVVEVVVSSVRPFELLMGKVLGIGAMGMAQMLTWVALAGGGLASAGTLVALFFSPDDLGVAPDASQEAMLDAANVTLPTIPVDLVVWFLLFFLGGYLLYSSLFAAVGSAVEQQQDAQNLLYPIMIPLFIPIIFAFFVLETPKATLSVVLSIVPFFSPILMPMRIAVTNVPVWEIALAFVLLVATFVGTIWLAARIYRVGILSYGKTPGIRDIVKWVTYE